MSKEATLVFFGIRFNIEEGEIPSVEDRSHSTVKKGRSVGLEFYWEDFGVRQPHYLGFIGRRLGILGVENDSDVVLDQPSFADIVSRVKEKLLAAGIQGEPCLYMQWMPPK